MARRPPPRQEWQPFGLVAMPGGRDVAFAAAQAGAISGLGGMLDRLLETRLAALERAALREGAEAGALAADADPTARMDPGTVRADAFNRAAVDAGARRLELTLRERLDELARQHEADPGALAREAQAFIDGMRRALPTDVRPIFQQASAIVLRPYVNEARRQQEARVADEAVAAFEAVQARRIEAISRNARNAAYDNDAARALAADLAATEADLVALGPRSAFTFRGVRYEADPSRAGALSVAQMERTLIRLETEAAEQAAMGAYERGPRTAAWIDAFERRARRDGIPGLDQDGIDRVIARMRADANRIAFEAERAAARAEREQRRIERELGRELREAEAMVLAGYMPPTIDSLIARTRGTELAPAVDQLVEAGREVQAFRLLPFEQQIARIETLKRALDAGQATPRDFAQYNRLRRVFSALWREADADGLSAYHTQVVGAPPPPLDFANQDTLRKRVRLAEEASIHFGRPVAPITAAEARDLARRFVTAETPEAAAAVLEPLLAAPAELRAAAVQAIEKARGSEKLPAGALPLVMEGLRDPATRPRALAILRGLMTEAPKPPDGTAAMLRSAIQTELGRGVPGVRMRAMEASGDVAFAALYERDRALIDHLARQRLALGEDAATAAHNAAAALYAGYDVIDRQGFAHVYLPRRVLEANRADIEAGLRLLRAEAALRVLEAPLPDGLAGEDAARAARHRRDRAVHLYRSGTWINDGTGLALIAPGTGEPVELRDRVVHVTLDEVLRAGRRIPGAAQDELRRIERALFQPQGERRPPRPSAGTPSGREAEPMVAP